MRPDSMAALLTRLGGWEGFEVAGIEEGGPGQDVFGMPAQQLVITLRPAPRVAKRCSRCGGPVTAIHEVTTRRVRDLPLWDFDTWLIVPRARVECPRCGPTVEAVSWLDKHERMTRRLAEKIAGLAMLLPLSQVAAWWGVHWTTAKRLHQRALEQQLGPITTASLQGVRRLAIDEFAIQKGHRYATVVVDADTRRVLWVARGRDRAALRPFFERLGPAGCAALEAVAVDMHAPFRDEVRAHCPQAAIVYDLFHVVAKYGRDVIDRVRVDETNKIARAAGPGRVRALRRPLKGSRWLLLKNKGNLAREDRVRLGELLAANRPLFIAYVLKDELKHLWRYRAPHAALRFWREWRRRALASRVAPLVRFCRQLEGYLPGILAHCRFPLHTGIVEGVNNKIKVLKRMAYGYRDDEYFFLRIRAAFPGNA